MKKEHVDYIVDSFTDYLDREHKFVIVALSEVLPSKAEDLKGYRYYDPNMHIGEKVYYDIEIYVENYGTVDCLCTVGKTLKLGIAICNPEDEFDEQVGYMKALGRARNSSPVILANNNNIGVIGTEMVKGLLRQEAEYVKNNPGKYIKGYKEAEEKYNLDCEMEDLAENFSSLEDDILDALDRDPNFLDDVYKYLKWSKKRGGE